MVGGFNVVIKMFLLGALRVSQSATFLEPMEEPSTLLANKVDGLQNLGVTDFTHGDVAWQERKAQLLQRFPTAYARESTHRTDNDPVVLAATAPLTVLYILSHYSDRIFPNGLPELIRVHVPGAAYPFEGRGDWSLLSNAVPSGSKLEVSLILGTPDHNDMVPELKRSLNTLRRETCRTHGNVSVLCFEKYYQQVAGELPTPHLVVMFNPGFPQIARRSWDATLLMLLKQRVPCAVSTQMTSHKGTPVGGEPWSTNFTEEADEEFPVHATLKAFGADIWGTTGSPFPIVSRDMGRVLGRALKNGAIEIFQGLKAGKQLPKAGSARSPAELLFLKNFDWKDFAQETTLDGDEVREGLETPVSDAWEVATDDTYIKVLEQKQRRGDFEDLSQAVRKKIAHAMKLMRQHEPLPAKAWLFLAKHTEIEE